MPGVPITRGGQAWILALSLSAWAPLSWAESATLAVATNFTTAMQKIAEAFEAQGQHELRLSFGSSGQLFAQIRHGAPYDAFLSADQAKPQRLLEERRAVAGSRFTYAIGALALWSSRIGLVDQQGQVLRGDQFRHLALANPRLAPYGAAALEALTALGVAERTKPRWVLGENIAQTYQFVHSGSAELGLVALSQILRPGQPSRGSYWRLPESLHAPIRQDAVLLERGRENAAARALLSFLRDPQARAILSEFGYRQEAS